MQGNRFESNKYVGPSAESCNLSYFLLAPDLKLGHGSVNCYAFTVYVSHYFYKEDFISKSTKKYLFLILLNNIHVHSNTSSEQVEKEAYNI